ILHLMVFFFFSSRRRHTISVLSLKLTLPDLPAAQCARLLVNFARLSLPSGAEHILVSIRVFLPSNAAISTPAPQLLDTVMSACHGWYNGHIRGVINHILARAKIESQLVVRLVIQN